MYEKKEELYGESVYSSRQAGVCLPKYSIPKEESDPRVVMEMIQDELLLDGNARQNLATFCQTYIDKEVRELMDLSISKNMIDKDEYPQSAEIEKRCIHMLAKLWNAPSQKNCVGTSTVGSSEACMLGGLAMYVRWKEKRLKEGKSIEHPNLVTGPVQICWHKFARYFSIELREVPMEENLYQMTGKRMRPYLDENTIGVVTTMGLTFTGEYESVEEICRELDEYEKDTGNAISVHVDGASGGFLAPFCYPQGRWDFRLERVKSISTSGHKFGLSPLGCGFVLWRERKDLPEELVFHVNYLGGDMEVFQLNFSRPAGQVISQYYLFLRLGMDGYRKIHENCYKTARHLAKEIESMGPFSIVFDGDPRRGIPAVTWTLKKEANVSFNLYDFADRLRTRGWQVPAYSLPANASSVVVQRALIRQGVSMDLISLLVRDMKSCLEYFEHHEVVTNLTEKEGRGFSH